MTSQLLIAQDRAPEYGLLWEISGQDLVGNSYVFGSVHLNDDRVFDLHDSLYFALSQCQTFANEVNFDSLGASFVKDLVTGIIEGDRQSTSNSDALESLDIDGRETLLDLYLFTIARGMNMRLEGLEKLTDQIALLDAPSFESDDISWRKGEALYEELVSIYQSGDLDLLNDFFVSFMANEGQGYEEDFKMIERNHIQTESIVRLARENKSFSVVGVGHLFGKDNVLTLLKDMGYSVRRVGRGEKDPRLENLYEVGTTKGKVEKIHGKIANYSFLSKTQYEPILINAEAEMHMDLNLETGLVYVTMALNTNEEASEEYFQSIVANFGQDSSLFIPSEMQKTEQGFYQDYDYDDGEMIMKIRAGTYSNLTILQAVLALSKKAMEQKNVATYFNSLEVEKRSSLWTEHTSAAGGIAYTFPEVGDFQLSEVPNPNFPGRGNQKIYYKIFNDPKTKDQYILRFHSLPPGIVYENEQGDLKKTIDFMATRLSMNVVNYNFFETQNFTGVDAYLEEASGKQQYFLRALIRGQTMYALLQSSTTKQRDDRFFEGVRAIDLVETEETTKFEYPKAGFSMMLPKNYYQSTIEKEGMAMTRFDFSIESLKTNVTLDFYKYDPYIELNLDDSLFTIETIDFAENTDSIYSLEPFSFGSVGKGFKAIYTKDSSKARYIQIDQYLNHHSFSALLVVPEEIVGKSQLNDLLSSMNFEIFDNGGTSLTNSKAMVIMNDLSSRDSVIHSRAQAAFQEYEDFTNEHVSPMLALFDQTFIDEAATYNTKYDLVRKLHDFEEESIEEALIKEFFRTEHEYTKDLILESLSKRVSTTCIPSFVKLLETLPSDYILSSDIYEVFSDSLTYFTDYYPTLKNLASRGLGTNQFLELSIDWALIDSSQVHIDEDRAWYDSQIAELISQYEKEYLVDGSYEISAVVMDYLLTKNKSHLEEQLFPLIMESDHDYGKYRIAYNNVKKNMPVDPELLDDIVKSDFYYHYWITYTYNQSGKIVDMPTEHKKMEVLSTAIMNYHYYQIDVDVSNCQFIKRIDKQQLDSDGEMAFVSCKAAEGEGEYYGIIGLYDESGHFGFDDDQSIYYNEPQMDGDQERYLNNMIEYYLNDKE